MTATRLIDLKNAHDETNETALSLKQRIISDIIQSPLEFYTLDRNSGGLGEACGGSAALPPGMCFVFHISPTTSAAQEAFTCLFVDVARVSARSTIFSVSVAPALLRRTPLTLDRLLPASSSAITAALTSSVSVSSSSSSPFLALSSRAAELGVGTWLPAATTAAEDQCCLAGWAVPLMQRVGILAVGRKFPFVDAAKQTIREWPAANTAAARDTAANQHLALLRKWIERRLSSSSSFTAVPDWMIPRESSAVDFWCAVSYTNSNDDDDVNDDDNDDQASITRARFLLPSSMIWSTADIRAPMQVIPPQFHAQVTQRVAWFIERLEPPLRWDHRMDSFVKSAAAHQQEMQFVNAAAAEGKENALLFEPAATAVSFGAPRGDDDNDDNDEAAAAKEEDEGEADGRKKPPAKPVGKKAAAAGGGKRRGRENQA